MGWQEKMFAVQHKHITNLEIGISRLQDRVAAIQAKIDMAPKEVADASKDLYFTNGEIDAAKLRR